MEAAQAARDAAQRQVAETQGQLEAQQRRADQAEEKSKDVRDQIDGLNAKIAEKELALSQALSTFSQVCLYMSATWPRLAGTSKCACSAFLDRVRAALNRFSRTHHPSSLLVATPNRRSRRTSHG